METASCRHRKQVSNRRRTSDNGRPSCRPGALTWRRLPQPTRPRDASWTGSAEALDKIRADPDLTEQGKARRARQAAEAALEALAAHRAKVEHARQWGRQLDADVKRQALGKEPSTERLFIRRELRDWLRGLSDSERTAAVGRALMSEDLDVLDAVRSAPAALNLFDAATVEMVEDYTPADLDPNTRAMLDGSRAINEGVAPWPIGQSRTSSASSARELESSRPRPTWWTPSRAGTGCAWILCPRAAAGGFRVSTGHTDSGSCLVAGLWLSRTLRDIFLRVGAHTGEHPFPRLLGSGLVAGLRRPRNWWTMSHQFRGPAFCLLATHCRLLGVRRKRCGSGPAHAPLTPPCWRWTHDNS